ncbi:hypothetical protein BY458DRAFT_505679 [Sporodiniella umbellata]|nr:hypothetical protein BY458DRAFT_505679 [Sporodiniella umbellata]
MESWNPEYHLKENTEQSSSTLDRSIHDEPQRATNALNPAGDLQNSNIQFSPSNRKENLNSLVPTSLETEEKLPSYETHRKSVPYDETIQFFGDSNATDTKNYPSRTLLDQEGLQRGNISTLPYAGDERRRSSTERRRSSALPAFEPREVTTHTPAKSDIPIGQDALQTDRENISSLPISTDNAAPSTHAPSNMSRLDNAQEKANDKSYTDMASDAMASVTATAAAAAAALFGRQTDFPTPNDPMPGGDMGKTPSGNENWNDYVSSQGTQTSNKPKSTVTQATVKPLEKEEPQTFSAHKPTIAQASLEPLVPEENIKPLERAAGSSTHEPTVAQNILEPLVPEEPLKDRLDSQSSHEPTIAQNVLEPLAPKDKKISEERSTHGPTLAQEMLNSSVEPPMHHNHLNSPTQNPSFGTATIFSTSAAKVGSSKPTEVHDVNTDNSLIHPTPLSNHMDESGFKETASSRDGGAMGLTSALNQISLSESDIANPLDSTQGPQLPISVGKNQSYTSSNHTSNHSRSNSSFKSMEKHAVKTPSDLSTHGSKAHGHHRGMDEHSPGNLGYTFKKPTNLNYIFSRPFLYRCTCY